MPSFLINPADINKSKELVISGQEAHHIQRVLRLGVGDGLTLFDGAGHRYEAQIIQQNPHQVTVKLLSKSPIPPPPLNITLLQCLPRLDKMDLIVQKAVELGVSRIIPVLSRRCRAVQPARLAHKEERWQRITAEAAKQCGQAHLPVIESAQALSELLEGDWGDSLALVLWEEEKNKSLKQLLRSVPKPKKIALLVGAEGGFTPRETGLLQGKGWRSAGLGPRILRLETAAIVGLGIIQYELGDLSL